MSQETRRRRKVKSATSEERRVKSTDDVGRHFEDFHAGEKIRAAVGRTISEADNTWFTLLTNNTNQIHFNADYAKKFFPGEPFKGRTVVNGFFTLGLVAGLLVDQTSANGFMLGIGDVRFLSPVFPGDTIYAECEVVETRSSRSRPGHGVVVIKSRGINQDGKTVVEFDRTFMVRKKRVVWDQKRRT